MRKPVVHMLGRVNGAPVDTATRDQRALCGPAGWAEHLAEAKLYKLLDEHGNTFNATTTTKLVTCKKCSNLLTIGRLQEKRGEGHLGSERHPGRNPLGRWDRTEQWLIVYRPAPGIQPGNPKPGNVFNTVSLIDGILSRDEWLVAEDLASDLEPIARGPRRLPRNEVCQGRT
jgi:hypothetical protein